VTGQQRGIGATQGTSAAGPFPIQLAGAHIFAGPPVWSQSPAGMRRPDELKHDERSIRYHVQSTVLSKLVFETGPLTCLRLPPPISATFANTCGRAPLGGQSAGAYVCASDSAVVLS